MSHKRQAPRTFSRSQAPRDYVAGLGRGAVGFTTRGDLGPLSDAGAGRGLGRGAGRGAGVPALAARTNFGQAPKGYVAGAGRGSGGFGETKPSAASVNTDKGNFGDGNFDAFAGFSGSLFASGAYDDVDREADRVWDAVEERMRERGKRKRERREDRDREDGSRSKLRAADQFADLKQQLKSVSYEEWDALPEASTGIRAHKRQDTLVPVSDAIILSSRAAQSTEGGALLQSSLNIERGRIIRDRLDADTRGAAAPSVDADRYLSSMAGADASASLTQVGDIRKARLLLRSVTTTNPGHAPGWIAAARLEEVAGQLVEARALIRDGCAACPKSEDVWVEAARLNTPANAKVLLERAVQELPGSVRIWQAAADLESADPERKKRVFRRALEAIPNSERLWMALVELEESQVDAHAMLARAVECVPHSIDMWLALARLEDYDQAKRALNKARKVNPAEPRIWVAACALEEANRDPALDAAAGGSSSDAAQLCQQLEAKLAAKLNAIMNKAVEALSSADNMLVDRDAWTTLAKSAERDGSLYTCRAIVHSTLTLGLEEVDWARTWADDAALCSEGGFLETARALHAESVARFPGNKQVLLRAIAFESKHGGKAPMQRLLQHAVAKCPEAELFWLMAAKETWKTLGDTEGARSFLARAFEAGHNSERVWLAAVKLEWESGQLDRARALLQKARQNCSTPAVFLKSALLERAELSRLQRGTGAFSAQVAVVRRLLEVACERFPGAPKLWMMASQLEVDFALEQPPALDAVAAARAIFLRGLKACSESATLWVLAARLEEAHVGAVKARSVLEVARHKCPANVDLWAEAIRLEQRAGQISMAQALLSKALQECPKAGRIWALAIELAPRPEQKSRSADALQHCNSDPYVLVALARFMIRERKRKGALRWFEMAVASHPDNGDAWLALYEYQSQVMGNSEAAQAVLDRCVQAAPRHGERWQAVAKKDANRGAPIADIVRQAVSSSPSTAAPAT